MLRRKKLLKLKRSNSSPTKPTQSKEYIELIDRCIVNTRARRSKQIVHDQWITEYESNFGRGPVNASKDSLNGIGAKRTIFDSVWKRPYIADDELNQREEKAIEEAKRKATMVAPIANKMGYQYIGNVSKEDLKTLGRKV